MNFKTLFNLSKRFLFSKDKDTFVSFIARVSIAGIALGVMALIVVTSVIHGFEKELAKVISGLNGDVVLYSYSDPVSGRDQIESKIKSVLPNSVQAISPSLIGQLMAANKGRVSGVILEGVDLDTITKTVSIFDRLKEGRVPRLEGEIVFADVLAKKLNLKVGDEVQMIAPTISQSTGASDQSPQVIPMKLVGLIHLGMYEYDSKYAFTELKSLQKLFGFEDQVSTFKIKLKDSRQSLEFARKLGEHFAYPFRAKDWSMLNKNLFYAIQLEKTVILIILLLIIIVAAFNVVSTLMMLIHDKTKEISIMKSMGFTSSNSFKMIVIMAAMIGASGIGIGLICSMIVNFVIFKTNLIQIPSDIYYIDRLPVKMDLLEMMIILVVSFGIVLMGSIFPAFKIARMSPMEGIKNDTQL